MTALVWDQVGERKYEAGVDRGVLYVPLVGAAAWNGLTSVSEKRAREVREYYLDGYKYFEDHVADTYSGRLQAYTYPEAMDDLLGMAPQAPGVFLHDQSSKPFGLSYRTMLGDDSAGLSHYRIHVLYNVRAVPSDTTHNTLSGGGFSGVQLEWNLTGLPNRIAGKSSTNHISFDSRTMDPAVLDSIEDILYGTSSSAPSLPSLTDLLALAT